MNPRIYLLALGTFALGTDAFVIAGVLPAIGSDMVVSVDTTGLLVVVFSLTYGVSAPLLSAFTSAIPRSQLLIGALLVFCLANICSALSPTFGILLLTRILAGVCAALYSPTAYTVAAALAPAERRGQALAIVVFGLSASTVLGVPLGTWLGNGLGWRMTFGFVAIIAGIAVAILFFVGLPQTVQAQPLRLRARLAPITQPRLLLALLPTFLWSVGTFGVYTYITPLLKQTAHVSDTGGLLLIYGVGGLLGNWLSGYSVDRFGSMRPLSFCLVVLALVMALLPVAATSLIGAGLVLFVWGAAGWSLFPPQQHRLLNLAGNNGNIVLALNNSALYLGAAAGAAIGGPIFSSAGVTPLSWAGSAFILSALLVLFVSAYRFSTPRLEISR